jgi:hypothetical protein
MQESSIYERLRGAYGDACMGASSVRRRVTRFMDRPKTAATESNKRRSHQTRLKDVREISV